MEASERIDFEELYNKLLFQFPALRQNPVWAEWDWSNDSCEQSVVISEVARDLINWAKNGEWNQVESLLAEIELAFTRGTD